ncbi:hypothetical protein DV737_g2151, partial [Chaetothyriales sp. CBS 132003]
MANIIAKAMARVDAGALNDIFDNKPGRVEQPVVQCVNIKRISGQEPGGPERYRVVFSDTKNYVQTMLATAANHHIQSGALRCGMLLQLLGYQANNVKQRKILIVTDLKCLEEYGELKKLGNPEPLKVKPEDENTSHPTTITSNTFYGNSSNQHQQSMVSHTKAPTSSDHANIYPIEGLSPYSHKWTIKVRCTSKSDIRTWHNRNGEGKLFSVNLLDESGEIRATGFNDECDQLYPAFQEGSVYYITSPCRVQIAKKQFSNINNDYELTFERDTRVEKAEDQQDVPQVKFNFVRISELASVEKDTTIDVIGILRDVGETSQITSKTTSKPYDKRELTLVDQTGFSVRLTVWGKTASSFDVLPGSVVAFKGVKVSDFGGRSLSLLSSGSMAANPDIQEAYKLKGWYSNGGQSENFSTHASVTGTVTGGARSDPFKTIIEVKDEQLGMSENADWFSVKASIQHIKQNTFCYPSCLTEGCNKKVNEVYPGQWRCERCDKNHPKPEYRYILSVNVSDHTGQLWLSCFDDTGRQLIGMTADKLMEIKETNEKKLADIFSDANCRTWNFKCKAKMDVFQEEQRQVLSLSPVKSSHADEFDRVRYQVQAASPLNFVAESEKLVALIKQYNID